MVVLPINGIDVDFPYQPYGSQIRYMSNVIQALRGGNNALLESPTGTGKTLCLLCAALAWRSTYVAALQAHANARPDAPTSSSSLLRKAGLQPPLGAATTLAAMVRPELAPQLSAPRIIFSSRTHSQLAQAVSELKKTVYRPGMSFLASRDQLCIHPISSNYSGSRLNAMCRRITGPSRRSGRCQYYGAVQSSKRHENRSAELVDKLHTKPPMDIEDLRGFGESESACPWYLSRASAKSDSCDILFLPYNYLLDRSARSSLGIDWANDILIIDEAHNLESVCQAAMSFDLSDSVRKACDLELSKLIENAVRPGGLNIPALEQLAKTEKGLDSVIGSERSDLMEIRLMRIILQSLEEFISSTVMDRGDVGDIGFRVFPGSQLRVILERAGGPTAENYEAFLELLERALGAQTEQAMSNAASSHGQADSGSSSRSGGSSAITLIQTAFRVLFESLTAGQERHFRTVVQQSKSKPAAGRTVSYWCFKPAVAMQSIRQLNMRCMLLTSGTLSPLESFAGELGVNFPVRLENPHVVTRCQVWAGVIPRGPDHEGVKGKRLTSAYRERGDETHVELGRTMIKIASLVPDGVLVFFPSYSAMYSCVDVWKRLGPRVGGARPSIWEHLLQYKRIVTEERESSKFAAAILAHRTNVDARVGSMLLAVCRGKVSEGIDFSDEYGRAVVITGLPFPSATDPQVILKRELCDEESKSNTQGGRAQNGNTPKSQRVNGAEWYTTQALRAVNQAIGRTIRHRFDYGAIILCDERFQSKRLQGQVSKWVRPSLKVYTDFPGAENALGSFFTAAVKSEFAKEGEQHRLEARKRQRENELEKKPEENMEAVLVAQETISKLLPPPTTEKQFLEQVMSISGEVKAESTRRKNNGIEGWRERTPARGKVLDFSPELAESGFCDSGSLRGEERQDEKARSTDSSLKRSAMFLASRAGRMTTESTPASSASPSKPAMKRIRITQSKHGTQPRFVVQSSEKPRLSETIKKLFAKKDVRGFLSRFREVLRIHSAQKEGTGPLQAEVDAKQIERQAHDAVTEVVQFTKNNTAVETQEAFFRELRDKIPHAYRVWYDEAVCQ